VSLADPRDVLLSRELLLRQTILTSGVWLIFIGFGAYLNTGTPDALPASGLQIKRRCSVSASCAPWPTIGSSWPTDRLLLWRFAGFRPVKVEIPLVWFDYIMRRVGPALPLPALALRW